MDRKVTAESGPVKFVGCGKLQEVEASTRGLSANGSEGVVFMSCATDSDGLTVTSGDLTASSGPVEFSGCGKDEETLDVTGNIQGSNVGVGGCLFKTLTVGGTTTASGTGGIVVQNCVHLADVTMSGNVQASSGPVKFVGCKGTGGTLSIAGAVSCDSPAVGGADTNDACGFAALTVGGTTTASGTGGIAVQNCGDLAIVTMNGNVSANSGPVKFVGCGKLQEVEASNGKQDSDKKELALSANGSEGIVFKNCATSSDNGLTITASDLTASAGPVEFSGCGKDDKTLDITGNIQGNSVKVGCCGFGRLTVGGAVIAINGDCDIVDCANLGTINLNANDGTYTYAEGHFQVGCPKLTTFDSKSIAADRVLFIGCGSGADGSRLEVHGDIQARNDREREYGVSFKDSRFDKYLIGGNLVAGKPDANNVWKYSLVRLSSASKIKKNRVSSGAATNTWELFPLVAVKGDVWAGNLLVHDDDQYSQGTENERSGVAYFKAGNVYLTDGRGNNPSEFIYVVAFEVPGQFISGTSSLKSYDENDVANIRCFCVGELYVQGDLDFPNGDFDLVGSSGSDWEARWQNATLDILEPADCGKSSFHIGKVVSPTTIRFGSEKQQPTIHWNGFRVNDTNKSKLRKCWLWYNTVWIDAQELQELQEQGDYICLGKQFVSPLYSPSPANSDFTAYLWYPQDQVWYVDTGSWSWARVKLQIGLYHPAIRWEGTGCVLDFQRLGGTSSGTFGSMENAFVAAREIRVNPVFFNKINLTASGHIDSNIFCCGTLDASRQKDDDETNLNSIEIENGVWIDNLVVADVGSLASIVIPDIPGVDAHGCGIAGNSGAKIKIGGRDFLKNLQTSWGGTRHLCLYGNGIKISKLAYVNPSLDDKLWYGKPFAYKSGSGPYDIGSGEWAQLPNDCNVLTNIRLCNAGEACSAGAYVYQQITLHPYLSSGVLSKDYIHQGTGEYDEVCGTTYYYVRDTGRQNPRDGCRDGSVNHIGQSDDDSTWWWKYPDESQEYTKQNLYDAWNGYKDEKTIYMMNWVKSQLNYSQTHSFVSVCPFGE